MKEQRPQEAATGRREGFLEKGQTLEPVRCWWVGFLRVQEEGRGGGRAETPGRQQRRNAGER